MLEHWTYIAVQTVENNIVKELMDFLPQLFSWNVNLSTRVLLLLPTKVENAIIPSLMKIKFGLRFRSE